MVPFDKHTSFVSPLPPSLLCLLSLDPDRSRGHFRWIPPAGDGPGAFRQLPPPLGLQWQEDALCRCPGARFRPAVLCCSNWLDLLTLCALVAACVLLGCCMCAAWLLRAPACFLRASFVLAAFFRSGSGSATRLRPAAVSFECASSVWPRLSTLSTPTTSRTRRFTRWPTWSSSCSTGRRSWARASSWSKPSARPWRRGW